MSKENNPQEKITSNGVKHIAKLARLGLTEKEMEKHQKEFLKILDYIGKLKEIDTRQGVWRRQDASMLAQLDAASGAARPMRKDEVSKFNKKLIDGHLKVKSIL